MHYKYYLFDLDGTITRSGEGIKNSVMYSLKKMGAKPIDDNTAEKFVGPPLLDSYMKYAGMSEAEAYEAIEHYREYYTARGWKESAVYVGIGQLIRSLKANGGYVALATFKPMFFVEKILPYFGLDKYFDCVSGVRLESQDADKVSVLKAALPEGANPGEAVMIGDRCYDIDAAKRLGMAAVGALYGYGTREELEASGADYICETPGEIESKLLNGRPVARGVFISFDGVDGCGKTTQLDMANTWLKQRGFDTVVTREPGGCQVSERVREILLNKNLPSMSAQCEALLFAAARAEHVRKVIKPALAEGKIVLCDRFLDSSVAYQGYGRELGEEFVRQINDKAVDGTIPDLTIILRVGRETPAKRMDASKLDRMENQPMEFLDRVRAGFDEIAAREPERVKPIDADSDVNRVYDEVRHHIDEVV